MKVITVSASKTYDVKIEAGILARAGEEIRRVARGNTAVVVTDSTVGPLYAGQLELSLSAAGFRVRTFVFPAGEQSKNPETYLSLLGFLAKNQVSRSDLLVALGGGVTGDLTGFAAATWLRGTDFVQIPTSLLAMVDSSVGGKTAIDLPEGKNLVGAFYQPSLVLCDPLLLDTLSPACFLDGCGEIVKYGVLGDRALLRRLQKEHTAFDQEEVIARCVEMKRDIVNADEFEGGLRQLLNLGHTLGHAVELRSNYSLPHGCAVSIGLAIMTRAAVKNGLCAQEDGTEILDTLTALGLPAETAFSADELLPLTVMDKKRQGDSITCVVPRGIGRCDRMRFSLPDFEKFIKAEG